MTGVSADPPCSKLLVLHQGGLNTFGASVEALPLLLSISSHTTPTLPHARGTSVRGWWRRATPERTGLQRVSDVMGDVSQADATGIGEADCLTGTAVFTERASFHDVPLIHKVITHESHQKYCRPTGLLCSKDANKENLLGD